MKSVVLNLLAADLGEVPRPTPQSDNMPGMNAITSGLNILMLVSLAMCVAGIILSAGLWAIGSFSNNYTQSINGKKGFLICVASALFIGAAYVLVEFFFGLGQGAGN